MLYREHPSYSERVLLWDFFMTSYKGGDAYIGSGLLHRHRFESSSDFNRRIQRCYYLNYVRPIVDTYTKYICGSPLSRLSKDKARFENFEKNCDGKNTPLASFIANTCTRTSIYGKMGVLVDGSKEIQAAPVVVTAMFDQKFLPRLRAISPMQLLDWSMTGTGEFEWILFTYTVDISSNPNQPRVMEPRYELWDRNTQTVFVEPKKQGKTFVTISGGKREKVLIPIEQFQHGLGVVPYCEFYHTDADEDGIPESMVEDLAIINRNIFNKCSLVDEIEYNQAFSQLVLPAEDGEVKQSVIGTSRAWTCPKDSPFPPLYISPDASQADLLRKGIQESKDEMYRIAVMRKGGTAQTDQYSTAYGKMVDFEDTEAALTSKSALMESCEKRLSTMVAVWFNKEEPLWIPSYPRAFEVRSFQQEIQDDLTMEELQMGETFMQETRKRLAHRALPQADSETMEKIEKEIEEIKAALPELDAHAGNVDPLSKRTGIPKPKQGASDGK